MNPKFGGKPDARSSRSFHLAIAARGDARPPLRDIERLVMAHLEGERPRETLTQEWAGFIDVTRQIEN